MADKENIPIRVTRSAAAKRAAAAAAAATNEGSRQPDPQLRPKRRRVALSELPTLSNAPLRPPPQQFLGLDPAPPAKGKKARSKKMEEKQVADFCRVIDNDEGNGDPQMCAPYVSDIYRYLRSMEVEPKRRPLANYIEKIQTDVTANMRAILVDWLVDVAEEYKLVSETLYLTINYIDRFLSANVMRREKLQLLGVSSMLAASKYEEISPPRVEDFCYITDNTYTKQEVVKMELDLLKFIKFEMESPTIRTFFRRFIPAGQEDGKYPALQLEFLGYYLAELSLLGYSCLRFLPSMIAASVVFLARFTINPNNHPWNATLRQSTEYRPPELKDCINAIHDLQLNRSGSNLVAIRDKYKQHRFKCVSTLVPPQEIPLSFLENIKEEFSDDWVPQSLTLSC